MLPGFWVKNKNPQEHEPYEQGFSAHDMNPDKSFPGGFLRMRFSKIRAEKRPALWGEYKTVFRAEWDEKKQAGYGEHRFEGFARRRANLWLLAQSENRENVLAGYDEYRYGGVPPEWLRADSFGRD